MNSLVIFAAALACASAEVLVHPAGSEVVHAPASATTIMGPDGSSIHQVNPGATVAHLPGHEVVVPAHMGTHPVHAGVVAGSVVNPSPAMTIMKSGLLAPAMWNNQWNGALTSPLAYAGNSGWGNAHTVISGPSGTISASQPFTGYAMY